jgi:hypothetical protein
MVRDVAFAAASAVGIRESGDDVNVRRAAGIRDSRDDVNVRRAAAVMRRVANARMEARSILFGSCSV